MNKLAAEKIAQEYYQIGQALALEASGLTKEANLRRRLMQALGGTAVAGTGLTAMHQAPELAKILTANAPGMEATAKSIVAAPGNLASFIGNKAGAAGQSISDFAQSMNIMEALKNLSYGN